jgi:hypothetical protein
MRGLLLAIIGGAAMLSVLPSLAHGADFGGDRFQRARIVKTVKPASIYRRGSVCGPRGCLPYRPSGCTDRVSCFSLYGAYGPYGGFGFWSGYSPFP